MTVVGAAAAAAVAVAAAAAVDVCCGGSGVGRLQGGDELGAGGCRPRRGLWALAVWVTSAGARGSPVHTIKRVCRLLIINGCPHDCVPLPQRDHRRPTIATKRLLGTEALRAVLLS